MSNTARALIALVTLAGVSPAYSQETPKPVVVRTYCKELSFDLKPPHPEFTVCDKQLASEPDWVGPAQSPPPLSPTQAALISRDEIDHWADDSLDWKVSEVRILEVIPRKWVYVVRWEVFDANQHKMLQLEIPILMSGKTVKGKDRGSMYEGTPAD